MRVVFMGRKPAASRALCGLVERGAEIVAVVAPGHREGRTGFARPLLRDTARELGLELASDRDLYEAIQSGAEWLTSVDLVISFLFWRRIQQPLIDLPEVGCFNFHPGPLPEFRGARGYNHAILEDAPEYGATVHWVSSDFDEGDLVEVRRFPIRRHETAFSLEQRTMEVLVDQCLDFVDRLQAGVPPERIPQGPGKSATREEMLALMPVRPEDEADVVERKVRAFWYPPHSGATIEIHGRKYTLVDEHTLEVLGEFLHGSRDRPY